MNFFRIDHEKGITLANQSVEVSSGANSYMNFLMELEEEVNVPILSEDFFSVFVALDPQVLLIFILCNNVMTRLR